MKKIRLAVLLVVLALNVFVGAAFAESEPVGSCPVNFELHMAMEHDGEMDHRMAGTMADQNGDGYVCVRHVTPTEKVHVHFDNALPLR